VLRAVIASEAKQSSSLKRRGLLRRFAPRNDDCSPPHSVAAAERGADFPSAAAIADISGFMK
jgi:hypothetical protein